MSLNTILGVACILSFTLPIITIVYNRYYTHRSLTALMIYYGVTALANLVSQELLPLSKTITTNIGIINNLLDVPLMLTALIFFCPGKQKQQLIRILTFSFVAYEMAILFILGFKATAIIYIMGPGIVIILLYSLFLFIRQVKFSILHGKNQGRTLMLASIFFMYASYALIYYFYYIMKTPFKADTIMLYYIASALSAILMSMGLHMMRKRMRELESIKTTRRELALFFGQA